MHELAEALRQAILPLTSRKLEEVKSSNTFKLRPIRPLLAHFCLHKTLSPEVHARLVGRSSTAPCT